MNTHTTIKSESKEGLKDRIKEMESRGFELDGEIVPRDGYYGIIYYAKMKWCGKIK